MLPITLLLLGLIEMDASVPSCETDEAIVTARLVPFRFCAVRSSDRGPLPATICV